MVLSPEQQRQDVPLTPATVSHLRYLPTWAVKHDQVIRAYRRVYAQYLEGHARGNGHAAAQHLLHLEQRLRSMGRMSARDRNGHRSRLAPLSRQNGESWMNAFSEPTARLQGGLTSSDNRLAVPSDILEEALERDREALADLLADVIRRDQKPFEITEELWEVRDDHTFLPPKTIPRPPADPRAQETAEALWEEEEGAASVPAATAANEPVIAEPDQGQRPLVTLDEAAALLAAERLSAPQRQRRAFRRSLQSLQLI